MHFNILIFNSIYTKIIFYIPFIRASFRDLTCFYFNILHFRLATFQALNSYMWLVAAVLGNATISNIGSDLIRFIL